MFECDPGNHAAQRVLPLYRRADLLQGVRPGFDRAPARA